MGQIKNIKLHIVTDIKAGPSFSLALNNKQTIPTYHHTIIPSYQQQQQQQQQQQWLNSK